MEHYEEHKQYIFSGPGGTYRVEVHAVNGKKEITSHRQTQKGWQVVNCYPTEETAKAATQEMAGLPPSAKPRLPRFFKWLDQRPELL